MSVSRSTNTIDDLYDGYTHSLASTTTSSFRISSSLDKSSSLTTLKEFVNSIIQRQEKINELTTSNINDEKAPLQNNVIVNTIKNKINKIITGPIIGFDTSDKYLAEIGVTNQMVL